MKVIVCKVHGFCAGVSRALSLAKMQLAKGEGLSILGPLVHNEEVGKKLEEKGAQIFSKDEKDFAKSLLSAPKDVPLLFSAHGHDPYLDTLAKERGLTILDGTCPFVRKNNEKMDAYIKEGYSVLYIGEKGHAECEAALKRSPHIYLYQKGNIPLLPKLALVAQTTASESLIEEAKKELKEKGMAYIGNPSACPPTRERREAILNLPSSCDFLLVLGSKKSKNSRALLELGLQNHPERKGALISNLTELKTLPLQEIKCLALTSGASTPESFFEEVLSYLRSF